MRWAVILCLIVGVGAGADASAQQVKDVLERKRKPRRRFERGRAAHNAGKTDEARERFRTGGGARSDQLPLPSVARPRVLPPAATAGFLRQPFIARRSGEAYNMAVKLDPTSIDAAEGRLEFLLGAPGIVGGGVDKARAEAARIATLDAYRGAMAEARIAEHEKEWPKAERLYRSLMAEYPDRTAAVDALVTILQNAKRFDEAFKIVDDRLARLPDESSSLYNLGRLSAVSGQHLARGESAMRRFLAMTGADPVRQSNAHYRLGMIKEKMGDAPAAATEYRAALDLYPRHEPAAAALKRIQR